MLIFIEENWWLYVLRGILALAFGLIALIWPGLTLQILVMLFGIYVIIEGALALVTAFRRPEENARWLLLFEGVIGILAGVFTFSWPAITTLILLVFISAWAIVTGVIEIIAAVQLRKEIKGEWILGLTGIVSILIGLSLIITPVAGTLALVWLIGIYALIFGALLIALGLTAHKT